MSLRHVRPSGLKKPRPLRRQSSCPTGFTESAPDDLNKSKEVSTLISTENRSLAVFTLKDKDGELMVLTGRNAKSVVNAFNNLVQSCEVQLVSMEMICDLEVKPEQSPRSTVHETRSDSKCEEHTNTTIPKTNVRYTKQDLIKLSQSKLCQTQPPLWNLLTHTHAPCCLPPDKVTYFNPSHFQKHDGTYVVGVGMTQETQDDSN